MCAIREQLWQDDGWKPGGVRVIMNGTGPSQEKFWLLVDSGGSED